MTELQLQKMIGLWKAYYRSRGIAPKFANQCLDYACSLLRQDMPVIFDLPHLCLLLGLDVSYLHSIVYGADKHYRNFLIRKKSGGVRELSAPHYTLKYVQTWIYENILSKVKVNYCAHGFCPKKSIVTNARVHVSNKYLLKLDLKDFFPSITQNQVINVFRSLGYSNHVAFYLGSICCVDGHLPQGAPTSPALSNIIAHHLDNRLLGVAKKMGYKYTRYADDLAFSGDLIKPVFVQYVVRIISECHFIVNASKVKLYKGKGAKILTGVSLANGQIRVPREYRRKLEQELYYIRNYGLGEHIRRKRIKNPHYLESVIGKTEFWLMLEPENEFAKQALEYLRALYNQKYNQ